MLQAQGGVVAVINVGSSKIKQKAPSKLLISLLKRVGYFFQHIKPIARFAKPQTQCSKSTPLAALMTAAMALPNMLPASLSAAELEQTQIQFGHYEEGGKQFWGGPTNGMKRPEPLSVDSMSGNAKISINDRTKVGIYFSQDTWSGATPYITTPIGFTTTTGASAYVNSTNGTTVSLVDRKTLQPLDPVGKKIPQPKVVNLWTSASAETRNQGRLTLNREWDNFGLGLSAGISDEPDYLSRTLGLNGRWDFNQKLTSVSAGVSHSSSRIDADLGTFSKYVDYDLYANASNGPKIVTVNIPGLTTGTPSAYTQAVRFRGEREDMSLSLGFTQVLSKNTTISSGLTYAYSEGFLENPHKLVLMGFANPKTPAIFKNYLFTTVFSMPEKRPDTRNQLTWKTHLTQFVPGPDAAMHLDYAYSQDDWGIKSHTVEASWIQPIGNSWTITPRVRYYSQTSADFYKPYFLFNQMFGNSPYPKDASKPGLLDFNHLPIDNWSSDQRLSAFGTRSFGLTITKKFENDIKLELGYEDYLHAGGLKLGGGGENSFADFHSKMVNIGLTYDFQSSSATHAGHDMSMMHAHHHGHAGADAPAGVMYAHMMNKAGDFMAGYSFMYARQRGNILNGSKKATDAEIVASCGTLGCPATPQEMTMQMHMLHFMYAPTDQINLMLMPQLVSMKMDNRILDGGFYTPVGGHNHDDMDLSGHSSGGFGDTTAAVLLQLLHKPDSELHLGLGVSIPTGSVDKKMYSHGGEFMDYGMQLGSGTWDFLPSLTMTGKTGEWSWGGQLSGVIRPGNYNKNGYVLGNVFQGTAWASYKLSDYFSFSLRALRTMQGDIRGELAGVYPSVDVNGMTTYPRPQHNSSDVTGNYGARLNDVGVGLNMLVPGREMQGDRISLEWLQPVGDKYKGYQLERDVSLYLNWNMMF